MWGRKTKVLAASGAMAPEFELLRLAGGTQSLRQILADGPVLLAFFKGACPVCQLTFPYLERLSTGSAVQIVGISQDDADATLEFSRRFGVQFPMLLDRAEDGYPASNAYGITSVPSLFLVEPDGRISTAFNGFSKREIEALATRAGITPFLASDHVPEWKAG